MRRKSYHHGRLREVLVAQGVQLLARKGAAGLSLRTLARRAGVSPAAPYRHFPTARALAEAIAAEGFARLQAAMAEALADPALAARSPLERLGHGYVRFAQGSPDHFQLMFSGRGSPERAEGPLHEAGEAAFAALTGTIVAAQKAGWVDRDVDPAVLAVTAWSFIHGYAMLAAAGFFRPEESGAGLPLPELLDASQSLLRRGWGTRGPAAGSPFSP